MRCGFAYTTGAALTLLIISLGAASGCTSKTPRAEHKGAKAVTVEFPARAAGFRLDASEKPRVFNEDSLWEHVDGGAPEILRLGFERLEVAHYIQPGSDREVSVEAYRMKSPGAAAALFDTWGSKEIKTGSLCGRSQAGGASLIMQKGATYAHLNASFSEGAGPVLERMARELCGNLTGD